MRVLRALLLVLPLGLAGCAVSVRPAPIHGHGYYAPARPYAYAPPAYRYPPARPYWQRRPYGHYRRW